VKRIAGIVFDVLSRTPSPIPSSLPGVKEPVTFDKPPAEARERRAFFEEERRSRGRKLLYRFWACDGFLRCHPGVIRGFLDGFHPQVISDSIPFLRHCIRVLVPFKLGGLTGTDAVGIEEAEPGVVPR
jgi:hypothetical protein